MSMRWLTALTAYSHSGCCCVAPCSMHRRVVSATATWNGGGFDIIRMICYTILKLCCRQACFFDRLLVPVIILVIVPWTFIIDCWCAFSRTSTDCTYYCTFLSIFVHKMSPLFRLICSYTVTRSANKSLLNSENWTNFIAHIVDYTKFNWTIGISPKEVLVKLKLKLKI